MTLCRETIPSLLDRAVLRFGMCCAVETTQERYSWREIGLLSDAAAESLAGRGIGRGDHVGIWGGNSLDWILAFLAVVKLGAVAVLINNHYTERELSEVLRTGRVDWLLFGDCPELEHRPDLPVYAMRAVGAGARRAVDMRTEPAVRRRRCTEGRFRPAQLAGNCCEVCCLLFTSGSTKQPKCVMMTHYSMVNNAVSMAETLGIRMEDRICLSTPLFHIFCLCGSFLPALYAGASLVIPEGLRSAQLLQCISRHGCSILNGVPTSYLALIRSGAFDADRMAGVRLGVLGGAPVLERQMAELQRVLPQTEFMINYGQTEGACICNTDHNSTLTQLAGTVGRPLPHIQVEIVSPDTGRRLDTGEAGELVVRGYNVMQGFYPPGCRPAAIDGQGWLHTDDLGRRNPDGSITLTGRKKDIIIRGGEDITPLEIESVIQAYEPILDVKVFGVPHEVLGEQVIACVVVREGAAYREADLRAWMQKNLAAFKIPAVLCRMERFPLSANGKLDLRRLKTDWSSRFHSG